MADNKISGDILGESALVAKLLAQRAENAVAIRGFAGRSKREGYVRLYSRLVDLSESMEIARADILHSMRASAGRPNRRLGSVTPQSPQAAPRKASVERR